MMPNRHGVTLIELIVFIIVAGIFVPLAYIAFSAATKSGTNPELMMRARFAAEQKMEAVTSHTFEDLASSASFMNGGLSALGVNSINGLAVNWNVCYVAHNALNSCITVGMPTKYMRIRVWLTNPSYEAVTLLTKRTADE